jgi:hypothetical protein
VAPLAGGNSRIGAVCAPTRQDVFARLEKMFFSGLAAARRAKKIFASALAQKDLESLKEEASGVRWREQKNVHGPRSRKCAQGNPG